MGQIIRHLILAFVLLVSVQATAANARICSDLFGSSDISRAAKDRVETSLGWLPDVRLTNLKNLSDIKYFERGAPRSKENAIASSSYRVVGKRNQTLEMEWTWVKESYRNKGLSELLIADILSLHPTVERIRIGSLTETNRELFEEANKSLGLKKSIRETYAYKRYARFGFTKIVDAENRPPKLHALGGKHWMVLDPGGVSFTLKRQR